MGSCCFDTDPVDVFNEKWRVAAKDHRCCECGAVIRKGALYQRVTMLYEGIWDDFKTCEQCADLRDSLSEVDCPYYRGLSECYTNFIAETGLAGLVKPGTHAARLVPSYYLQEDEDE